MLHVSVVDDGEFSLVLNIDIFCDSVEKIFHDICNQSSFDPIFVHRDDKDANYIVSVCPSISRKSVQLHRCIVANLYAFLVSQMKIVVI